MPTTPIPSFHDSTISCLIHLRPAVFVPTKTTVHDRPIHLVGNPFLGSSITEQTFYRWRNEFDSMTVLEVRRLKELEHDNVQLKQIVADLTLDNRILRDVNQKSGEAVGAPSNSGLSHIQLSAQ